MRKQLYLLLGGVLLAMAGHAQSLKDFFASEQTPLTYLGVDFTRAKVLGEAAVPAEMRDRHFPAINNVILNEPKKYDLNGAFHRTVTADIAPSGRQNEKINPETLVAESTAGMEHLQPAEVESVVKGYDFGNKKGIGLLLVMETMSKPEKEASMYVVLADMSSKKVLLSERMHGKAQGFGFRNYWAYTVYKVLEDIRKHRYKEWKAKYAN